MSNTQMPQRVAVILNGPMDWDEWLEVVKTKSVGGKIWDFVNPNTNKDELPILEKPMIPSAKDVNPLKTVLSQLTDDEKDKLKLLRYDFKHQPTLYERQDAALASLRLFIQETISRTFLPYTFNCNTPYDILVALRRRIAPTDKARKLELTQRYQKLKSSPRAQNVDTWLQQWERTYTECKDLNLAVVADEQPVYDFLQAVADISPEFSNVWMVNLQTQEADGEPLPDFYRIVELFRNHQRLSNAQKGRASQSTFTASFQEQSLQGENSLDLNNKKKLCLCGMEHRFKACPYLIESIRPKDWKPDQAVQKNIDEKLKNSRLKAAVERAQKQVAENQEQQSATNQNPQASNNGNSNGKALGAFGVSSCIASASTDYHLRNSFILDSGATLHVCNDKERFEDLRSTSDDDCLFAGNTIVPTEGFGTITITVQTLNGPRIIKLLNTALVSSFHTSVVSLDRFMAKGVHWDTEGKRVHSNGQTFCSIERYHGQWVLEYNADLAKQLPEQADQIVEVIEIPSISGPLIEELDTNTEEEEEEALEENRQTHQKQIEERYDTPRDSTVDSKPKTPEPLPISPPMFPTPTSLSPTPLPNIDDQQAIDIEPLTALNHRQNTASRANEISSDFSEENIIEERTRRRRQAYLTTLEQPEMLPGYLSTFTSGAQLRLHRGQLLPPPRTWKELLVHPYCEGFRAAVSKDIQPHS
jgi:hypothetical protein